MCSMDESRSLDAALDDLGHEDLLEITQSSLRRLVTADPLLSDLPGDVTVEEVLAQIAVAQGRSITVTVLRHLESPLSVVIPQQGTTVRDLKRAIQRSFTLRQQRLRSKTKISWRYIWRCYDLVHWGTPMRNDSDLVSAHGVVNKSEIRFGKKLRRKGQPVLDAQYKDEGMVVARNLVFGCFVLHLCGWMLQSDSYAVVVEQEELQDLKDQSDQKDQKKYPWLEQVTRQELVNRECRNSVHWRRPENHSHVPRDALDHLLVDKKHKLLYCYVPKIACTNWKRVFMMLTGTATNQHLVEIPGTLAHAENSTKRLSQFDDVTVHDFLNTFTTFILVRHPFERLLSAFRNKFENTYTEYFQLRYGRSIIRKYRPNATVADLESGKSVSFREFVLYLIDEGPMANEHWQPVYQLCRPCSVNYTFIGRYETLLEDATAVLDMVSAPPITFPVTRSSNTADKLRAYFQQLSMAEIRALYKLYEMDFKLFGYTLEDMLGFDLA